MLERSEAGPKLSSIVTAKSVNVNVPPQRQEEERGKVTASPSRIVGPSANCKPPLGFSIEKIFPRAKVKFSRRAALWGMVMSKYRN